MPSHHKRHTPARTANGPIAADAAAPTETANPESSSAAPSTPTPEAPPPQPQGQAQPPTPPQPAPPPPQQPQQRAAARRSGTEHHRSEGHEHSEAHPDREGSHRRRRDRHAEAGFDLSDPESADRAERLHLFRGRARGAAGRLRLPARARLQLPARPGRHLRLAVADSEVRPADRRHRLRPDPSAEGRRALLRADQGGSGQLRGAGSGARQALLREPHAALPAGADHARDAGEHLGAHHGSVDADRQRAARPDRRAAAHRQDDAAAEHRAVGGARTIPRCT